MIEQQVQQEDDEDVVVEEPLPALAAAAARLRQLVTGNEARMRQLDQFVRRLDELLQAATRLHKKEKKEKGPPPR